MEADVADYLRGFLNTVINLYKYKTKNQSH